VAVLESKLGVENHTPAFHLPYEGDDLPQTDGG